MTIRESAPNRISRRAAESPLLGGERPRFLVGAAIGTGIAAQSATRGGADFLIALSAGRMRCIGEPSIAAMLPLRDSNEFVLSFAPTEILPRATVPLFFGAASFDPRLDLADLVDRVAKAGFSGIANFPTAILIDGDYRRFLEQQELGFGRELDLLTLARQRGLSTLAYTHTAEEAMAAAKRGVDIVNIDLGWNVGGVVGATSNLRIEDAALMANAIAHKVRTISRRTRCVVEGGPIVNPRQLEELCQIARVDGYIGGSTIDRVPSEAAIEVVTAAFKAIGALRQKVDGLEERLDPRRVPRPLWGHSHAAENARSLFNRLSMTDHPVLIVGEPGTGRRELARALHQASPRRSRDLIGVPCADETPERLRLNLFGCMAGAHPTALKNRMGWLEIAHASSLMLDDVDALPIELQRALLDAVESGQFWRLGGGSPAPLDVRFLGVARQELRPPRAAIDPRFAEWMGCFTIVLPPLRERTEDLPSLIEETLRSIEARLRGGRKILDPAAFRALADHHWPGNLRELASVLERAALASSGGVITEQNLPPLNAGRTHSFGGYKSEKEWILHGLRRNRFRRSKTADYLGISRKTLYNKMRTYGLQSATESEPEKRRGRARDDRQPAPGAA